MPPFSKQEFDEFKDQRYADWRRIRLALEHENTLVNHRITWLLTSQAFLIAALVGVFNEAQKPEGLDEQQAWWFSLAIAAISLTICLAIGRSLAEASFHLDHLDKWWYRKWNENKDWANWEGRKNAIEKSLSGHPEIQGRRSVRVLRIRGVPLWPFTFGTVVFLLQAIWSVVICISMSNIYPSTIAGWEKVHPDQRFIRNSLSPDDLNLFYSIGKQSISSNSPIKNSDGFLSSVDIPQRARLKIAKKHGIVFANEELVRLYRVLARNDMSYRLRLAMALSDLGLSMADRKRWNNSFSATNEALGLMEPIARDNPSLNGELAAILNNIGVLYRQKGDSAKSTAFFERSKMIYVGLSKNNSAFKDNLQTVLTNFRK